MQYYFNFITFVSDLARRLACLVGFVENAIFSLKFEALSVLPGRPKKTQFSKKVFNQLFFKKVAVGDIKNKTLCFARFCYFWRDKSKPARRAQTPNSTTIRSIGQGALSLCVCAVSSRLCASVRPRFACCCSRAKKQLKL